MATEYEKQLAKFSEPFTEERYTLSEASKIFNEAHCATQGHSVLWIPTRYETDPGDGPKLYACVRCSRRCQVEYPLDSVGPLFDYGWTRRRRAALRKLCNDPAYGKYTHSAEGHLLVQVEGYEWCCSRCDAKITFVEEKGDG